MAHLRSRFATVFLALAAAASLAAIAITSLPASSHGNIVALECNAPGVGAASADLRGIRFAVSQSFVSVEVPMAANAAGAYSMTAELRRSNGFTDPLLAAVRLSASLPGDPFIHPYPTVHFEFPRITVVPPLTLTFTLRFTDITGPLGGDVYIETTGLMPYPCTNVMVTGENDVAAPTEYSDPAGFRVLGLRAVQWGDVDCSDGSPNAVDALKILREVAGLSVSQTQPCPAMGQIVRP